MHQHIRKLIRLRFTDEANAQRSLKLRRTAISVHSLICEPARRSLDEGWVFAVGFQSTLWCPESPENMGNHIFCCPSRIGTAWTAKVQKQMQPARPRLKGVT